MDAVEDLFRYKFYVFAEVTIRNEVVLVAFTHVGWYGVQFLLRGHHKIAVIE
jgi:hypothetical protein